MFSFARTMNRLMNFTRKQSNEMWNRQGFPCGKGITVPGLKDINESCKFDDIFFSTEIERKLMKFIHNACTFYDTFDQAFAL